MKIRFCKEGDRAEVNRLLYQSTVIHSAGVPDFFIPLEESINEKIYAEILSADDQVLFCAENEDGVLCGVCHLSFHNRSGWVEMKNVHVENIVVDETCRGQGIGHALMAEAERIAKEWGAVQLNLMCWHFNDGARRLYESLGMTEQRSILVKDL